MAAYIWIALLYMLANNYNFPYFKQIQSAEDKIFRFAAWTQNVTDQ